MSIHACVFRQSTTKLWGLTSIRRLKRQLRSIGGIQFHDDASQLPADGEVLILDGNYLFEIKTLESFLEKKNHVLTLPDSNEVAAALLDASAAREALAGLSDGEVLQLPGLARVVPADMAAFNETLRNASIPLLERVTQERKSGLEALLYGNAYRGITDLVTKFLWPRPARRMVQFCAAAGLSPNMVTTAGLLLVIYACWAFLNGHYVSGLLAGWIMTFLDTVDGKLARVTVQSSPFGNIYDHGIDLLHPPFWYIFWGMSLEGVTPVLGFDQSQMYWLIVLAYVLGRVVEGLFPLLGNCSIFTWRPFDAWFRLVTARRNPCLILLTLSVMIGRPDWGFLAVVWWSVLTTLVLVLRLLQAALVRARSGPLESWLSADDVATGPHARAYRVFGATRGAYAAK